MSFIKTEISTDMAECILVSEEEGDEPMEIPVEDDGTLLLSTLAAQFPGSCGLRFRNPDSGAFRGVRLHEGRLYPPENDGGWVNHPFVAVFPKHTTDSPGTAADNKRKGDQVVDNPFPKTKKLENIKCSDLIVLGLDYSTTEETMRDYFSDFGSLVLCDIKKRQEDGKSRGFGFIKFTDYKAQRRVLSQRHEIDSRQCDVKIPASKEGDEQSRRVFIGRVPEDMTGDTIKDYFKQFGEIIEVFIPKPYRPFAFVTFDDPEVAQSLCGQDYMVDDNSLLVRSAAPRQGEKRDRLAAGGGGSGGGRYMERRDDRFNRSAPVGQRPNMYPFSQPPPNPQPQYNNNPFQQLSNPAVLAAALSQVAQQAVAQAAQQQAGGWPNAATAQALTNSQTSAAVQALMQNTAAAVAGNKPWPQDVASQLSRASQGGAGDWEARMSGGNSSNWN